MTRRVNVVTAIGGLVGLIGGNAISATVGLIPAHEALGRSFAQIVAVGLVLAFSQREATA